MDGIKTVFDGGAGCGRFSILLAKHGCEVTHFDISQPMINKAKELAEKEGVLDKIIFVKGALEDLSVTLLFHIPTPIRNRLSGNSYAFAANVL